MIYMTIFWILIVITIVVHYIIKKYDNEQKANDTGFLILIAASSFLVVAIVTKDPLFTPLGVPAGYEWVFGIGTAGFFAWRLYLNPLKSTVLVHDKDIAVLKSEMIDVKEDIHELKSDMKTLNLGMFGLKQDMELIKNKILR